MTYKFGDAEQKMFDILIKDDKAMDKALRFMIEHNMLKTYSHSHIHESVSRYMERHDGKISDGFIRYWNRHYSSKQNPRVKQMVPKLIKKGFTLDNVIELPLPCQMTNSVDQLP